jgi:hypothetical protein
MDADRQVEKGGQYNRYLANPVALRLMGLMRWESFVNALVLSVLVSGKEQKRKEKEDLATKRRKKARKSEPKNAQGAEKRGKTQVWYFQRWLQAMQRASNRW